ncbi:MAG: hypothetical protein KKB50_09570 [Planctomycetes bacterium]|nr:hypothetical protein [Planctomycetota bacterium]
MSYSPLLPGAWEVRTPRGRPAGSSSWDCVVEFLVFCIVVAGTLLLVLGRLLRGVPHPPGRVCTPPGCGRRNPPSARFCGRCGRQLPDQPRS